MLHAGEQQLHGDMTKSNSISVSATATVVGGRLDIPVDHAIDGGDELGRR